MSFKEFYIKEDEDKYFYHGSAYDFSKFDMTKAKTGDGLNKYGYGIYFADNKELAEYYAFGKSRYIYTVKLYDLNNFYDWESQTSDEAYNRIYVKLNKYNYQKDADEMKQEADEYGENWTIKGLYHWLSVVLKSEQRTTEWLNLAGISGVMEDDLHGRGKIYVAFDDDNIKIVDKEML